MLTAFSVALGFGRESYIAYAYGATGYTDAFYVAAIVPDMVAGWISYSLTNALIPVLKEELHVSPISAKRLVGAVFWNTSLALAVMTALGLLTKGVLVSLLAPRFSLVEHAEAVRLLRIMMVAVLFSGLSGVLWGIHNAHENFYYPSMVGIIYNILLLTVALLLHPWVGIEALAYGFLAGTIGRFLVQFIPLVAHNRLGAPDGLWHPALRSMMRSMGPIFASVGVGSLNLIVDRILASGLNIGHLSDMNYASKIGMLPNGLIGVAIATVLYTRFVTHTLEEDETQLRRITSEGFGWLIFVGLIVMSGFVIYAPDLVAALYHRGAFTAADVRITQSPLLIYGWFGVFYLASPLVTHFFFARKENAFVMRSSLLAVAVNIVGSLSLVGPLGIVGLVLANALSQAVYVLLQTRIMLRRLHWSARVFLIEVFRRGLAPGLAFAVGAALAALTAPEHGYAMSSLAGLLRGLYGGTLGTATLLLYVSIARGNMVSRFLRDLFCGVVHRMVRAYRKRT